MKHLLIFCAIILLGTLTPTAQGQWNSDYYQGVVRPAATLPNSANTKSSVYSSDSASSKKFVTQAILFGVNDYGGKLSTLSGCVNDMARVQEWIRCTHQPQPGDVKKLCDQDATCQNLLTALELAQKKTCDRLIVVIACHGGSAHGKSFICPQDLTDLNFDGVSDEDVLNVIRQKNLIPLSDLLATLKTASAKDILLILDSCRNTQTGDASFMREFQDLMANYDRYFKRNRGNLAVITSCSFGQQAEEYSSADRDYGKFLYFFTDGLTGKADFTGCYDNQVTLTEAYNYAYSKMGKNQTPEIFMASTSQNMVLARYEDLPRPEKPEQETNLNFLLRTGVILSNIQRWSIRTNQKGLKALDCVLENVPNNAIACSVRGSVHRRTGNYEQALLDWSKVGQKLQLYVGKDFNQTDISAVLLDAPQENANSRENKIAPNDLLTISAIRGDFLQVSEINNQPIQTAWIHRKNVYWDLRAANGQTTATQAQRARTYNSTNSSSSGPGPGQGGLTAPFVSPIVRS